jgi:ribonucleoside-diphosphate reductase alpha chain
MTNDPDIRFATSLVDYVFRRLALDHLPSDVREGLGIRSIEERKLETQAKVAELIAGPSDAEIDAPIAEAQAPAAPPQRIEITDRPTAKVLDAPLCYQCGSKMQPAGSCYVCGTCGSTSGCS